MDCASRQFWRFRREVASKPFQSSFTAALSCQQWITFLQVKCARYENRPLLGAHANRERYRCKGLDEQHELSPDNLMREVAASYGLRVIAPSRVQHDSDDEDDDWDEVVSELGNPWDMRPARVGLLDDDEPLLPQSPPQPPNTHSETPPAAAGDAAAAAPHSAAPPPPGPATSPYLDPTALPRLGRRELAALLEGPGRGDSSSAEGPPGGGGGGVGGVGGPLRVLLLDVREEQQQQQREEEEGSAGASTPQPTQPPADPDLLRHTPPTSLMRRNVPLSELRRDVAEALAAAADVIAVQASGDHRGEQAVIRLTKVYGMSRVVLYYEAVE